MKQVLIFDNTLEAMKLNESVNPQGQKNYTMTGLLTLFNEENRNNRIYKAEKFLPHLEEMMYRINTKPGVVYGEFDHPENFDTSMSRISHKLLNAYYVKEKNAVYGDIKLLTTYFGKEARALVDDGDPIFVSSRAAGVTESNKEVTIKKLFTYDIVADPGFAEARMESKSMNESLGFSNNSNFRIIEVIDESKINEMFHMNDNKDLVTKMQLTEYSEYIKETIENLAAEIKQTASKTGAMPDFDKMTNMIAQYESLLHAQEKVSSYLDYLAENMSTFFIENKALKETTTMLVEKNENLSKDLEKAIGYVKYVAENVDNAISFGDYIAENLKSSIKYQNYLAESVDKAISYGEYIAENLKGSIDFSNYLAENLSASIEFSEYVAENTKNSIDFSNYLAENLDSTVLYAQYIAENVGDNIDYTKYIAESLDKTIGYNVKLVEGLNSKNVNESTATEPIQSIIEFMEIAIANPSEEEEEETPEASVEPKIISEPATEPVVAVATEEPEAAPACGICMDMVVKIDGTTEVGKVINIGEEGITIELTNSGEQVLKQENELVPAEEEVIESKNLTESIQALILETKKREASKQEEPHFFTFLNESEIKNFKQLTNEEQETVIVAIKESNGYFSKTDVLKIMHKALSVEAETQEERLIKNIPSSIKPLWESLDLNVQRSVIAQSKFYSIDTQDKMEHFWTTRKFNTAEPILESKKVLGTNLIDNDLLNESQIQSMLNKFDRLK